MAAARHRVALISLRFKPGFVSHLVAFGKACRELGREPDFVVDLGYTGVPELAAVAPVLTYQGPRIRNSYTHALFTNVSLENLQSASYLKSGGTKILYLYHEPRESSLSFFRTEGILDGLRGAIAHHLSAPMLRLADAVILPSRYGADVYGRGDIRYNPNAYYVPLLFDDETGGRIREEPGQRRYFSYIGAVCQAHGFDQYIAFMRESLARKSNLRFLIASRLPLPPHLLKDSVIRRNLERIEIRCGRPLRSAEINKCYMNSFCVWNLYRRTTQSGVLPKAFMFGTPVLASRLGSFPEFVKDKLNGRFAFAEDTKGIEMALQDIFENISDYAVNCRETFLRTFFYRTNLPELETLFAR